MTVPYEEIAGPDDLPGEDHRNATTERTATPPAATESKKPAAEVPRDPSLAHRDLYREGKWEAREIHFGEKKGTKLGELPEKSLNWWIKEWRPKSYGNRPIAEDDHKLRAALDVAEEETAKK